jgi:YVTN family beta-propeller protein
VVDRRARVSMRHHVRGPSTDSRDGPRRAILDALDARTGALVPRSDMRMNTARGWSAAAAAAAALLAMTAGCGGSPERQAEPSAATPSAATAPSHRLYVSNETQGQVVVIDATTGQVVDRIAVGKRPRGLKLSADGTRLYVALSGSPIAPPGVDESTLPPKDPASDGIGVVDVATRKLVRTFPSGQDPESFDLSTDGRLLYVSNEETAEMSILDLGTGVIRTRVKVGDEPEGVTTSPDGKTVWVTCEEDNEIVGVDTTSFAVVARVPTAKRPRAIVFTRDGATMFVTGEFGFAVSVVDVASRKVVKTIDLPAGDNGQLPARPMGAVLSADGRTVYVSNGRGRSVAVIDVASQSVTRTFPEVGERPWGIALSPDGSTIYTANGPGADVSFIDVTSGKVTRKVATDGSPWGVVVK